MVEPVQLSPLLFVATFVVSTLTLSCTFDTDPDSPWRFCDCQTITGLSIRIFCRGRTWTTVPKLPQKYADSKEFDIVSLNVVDGALVSLNQDTFKGYNVQLLDVSHNQIETVNVNAFRGLESKLHQISLNHNSLSSISSHSLTYLHQLQYLYMQFNRIMEIASNTFDETQLKNLRFLHLDHNLVSVLPRQCFGKLDLQVLTMANNQISYIEEKALPTSLWFIDLKNNVLNSVPYWALKGLTGLSTLDLEGNNIAEMKTYREMLFENEINLLLSNNRIDNIQENALAGFRKFKVLNLSYNRIRQLPNKMFDSISQMTEFDLSYNRVTNIPENTFYHVSKSLRRLSLEKNEFHTLPHGLRTLRTLEHLNLNNNKLTKIDGDMLEKSSRSLTELLLAFNRLTKVPTELLQKLTNLRHLDLSRNRISTIEKLAFGIFSIQGSSLIRLNLAANRLVKISDHGAFLYLSSLVYLDLSHNQLEFLSKRVFGRLAGLESLFLQSNRLSQFPKEALESLSELRYLILNDNQITSLPDGSLTGLPRLQRLAISRNRLIAITEGSFPSQFLTNLRSIDLTHNQITTLSVNSFDGLIKLQTLHLGNNKISTLPAHFVHNLTNLKVLNLVRNRLVEFQPLALSNLPQLERLSFSHNQLTNIERGSFVNVNRIEQFDLSHNQFESINLDFLLPKGVQSLKSLDLSNNRLSKVELQDAKRTVVIVNLANNKIQSLNEESIEGFEVMEKLDLSNNGLIDIESNSLVGCPKLAVINLRENYLKKLWKGTFVHQELYSQIDLSSNVIETLDSDTFGVDNVHILDLFNNEFGNIPYKGLNSIGKSLSDLNLSGNQISAIESVYFEGLINLTILNLSKNRIGSIEEAAFKGLHRLRKLDLSDNPVTSWDPQSFKDLGHSMDTLTLANTGLFSLPKISPRGIRHLNLSGNNIYKLTDVDMTPLDKLISLDVSRNNLAKLDAKLLANLPDLTHLNISTNPLSVLADDHLVNLHRLESLSLHDMSRLTSLPSAVAFGHLRRLRRLLLYEMPKIDYYNSTRLLQRLPPLRHLHLEIKDAELNGQLHSADCRLLRRLTIVGNRLIRINAGALSCLQGYRVQLTISNTSIGLFPDAIFRTLTGVHRLWLDVSGNRLDSFRPFPYTDPPTVNRYGTVLARLAIAGNRIVCDCRLNWLNLWIDSMRSRSLNDDFFDWALCTEQSLRDLDECRVNGTPTSVFSYSHSLSLLLFTISVISVVYRIESS